MSLINVVKYAKNRGIEIRGEHGSPEWFQHMEELRCQAWREYGFELFDGKWKKMKYFKIIGTRNPPHDYYGTEFHLGVVSALTMEDALVGLNLHPREAPHRLEEITKSDFDRYWEFVL
jgi:hypothetical protein